MGFTSTELNLSRSTAKSIRNWEGGLWSGLEDEDVGMEGARGKRRSEVGGNSTTLG